MKLVLVRHGEPQAAFDGVVAGLRGCRGLTPLGRKQIEALRDRFQNEHLPKPDVVACSVLARARESAELLAPMLGVAAPDCELCELHPGTCDGEPWEQWAAAYPSPQQPDMPMSQGGETLEQFDRRVRSALSGLQEKHPGKTVVLVTHSGVIEAMTLALLGLPGLASKDGPRLDALRYASVTEWDVSDRPLLVRYNDYAHITPLGRSDRATAWPE